MVIIYVSEDSEGSESDEAEEDLSELTTVKLFAKREKKLNEKKELIGTTASKLVEDPENNVKCIISFIHFDIRFIYMYIDWLTEDITFTLC